MYITYLTTVWRGEEKFNSVIFYVSYFLATCFSTTKKSRFLCDSSETITQILSSSFNEHIAARYESISNSIK